MGVKSVFAYDKYTLEDYVFFDPVSSSPCDYTNYWTPYNQNTTCYRFVVLNPNDTASEATIKVLLDHDVDYGTEKIFDFGHYFAIRHLVVTAERTVDTLLRTVREHAVDKF